MAEQNQLIWKDNKKLRCGYTTGSCAAAAAKAALQTLLTGKEVVQVKLMTPAGVELNLAVNIENNVDGLNKLVTASIIKDGGDDFDVTHGLKICATVSLIPEQEIQIDGGTGVGRVTKKGLDQPVGAAAINHVPREMIAREMQELLSQHQIPGGVRVIISVPDGEQVAGKTFNPRLGIVGGISILGTTGIVVPMSEEALIETIRVEMKQKIQLNHGFVAAVPGNYGERFMESQYGVDSDQLVICSNYIGDTIDAAVEFGAKKLLLVGHIGKFIKLAAGIMNTHSRHADGRMEILSAHSLWAGADVETSREILDCNTTEEAVELLKNYGILKEVMQSVIEKIQFYLDKRAYDKLEIGVIVYSQEEGILGKTENADGLLKHLQMKNR